MDGLTNNQERFSQACFPVFICAAFAGESISLSQMPLYVISWIIVLSSRILCGLRIAPEKPYFLYSVMMGLSE
jgi:hypothetical protein